MKKIFILIISGIIMSCSTTQNTVKKVSTTQQNTTTENSTIKVNYKGLKRKVAIARFSNETLYGKGVFYSKENDPLANKATDILSSKLAQSGKFLLLERSNDVALDGSYNPSDEFNKSDLIGVDYVIVGSISEFGRKDETDSKVFSRSREQTAIATVNVRLVDIKTGQVIYGEEGTGSSATENKSSFGVGSSASYDTSINDQAISAAISKLIDNLINKLSDSPWKSFVLSEDSGNYFIAGGKSQGIKTGNIFSVVEEGKKVRNPQTGSTITLPGKEVAKFEVIQVIDTPNTNDELSLCSIKSGSINGLNINKLIIKENEN